MSEWSAVGEKAIQHFDSGFNCAESVFLAVAEAIGQGAELVNMATGFGGGVGRNGSLCGAISGAVLAVGLIHGRHSASDSRDPSYNIIGEFWKLFTAKFPGTLCCELTGVDLKSEAGAKEYKERIHGERCCPMVCFAASKMSELLTASQN
jgi:C_GCAxxG_C_C family probable redox protein